MGRTTLTRTTLIGPYPSLPVSADALNVTMTAVDTTNHNQFVLDGPMILLVQNTGASDYTFTLTSAVDPQNRTGDITTYTLSPDEIAAFNIPRTEGWKQTDGYFYLTASNTAVKFGILRGL